MGDAKVKPEDIPSTYGMMKWYKLRCIYCDSTDLMVLSDEAYYCRHCHEEFDEREMTTAIFG